LNYVVVEMPLGSDLVDSKETKVGIATVNLVRRAVVRVGAPSRQLRAAADKTEVTLSSAPKTKIIHNN
jgi:hypothetical protein